MATLWTRVCVPQVFLNPIVVSNGKEGQFALFGLLVETELIITRQPFFLYFDTFLAFNHFMLPSLGYLLVPGSAESQMPRILAVNEALSVLLRTNIQTKKILFCRRI